MRNFKFARAPVRKIETDACEGCRNLRGPRCLAWRGMEEINLLGSDSDARFLFELTEAIAEGEPDDQRVQAKKADHWERPHGHKGKAGNETHAANDTHYNRKCARAERPVGRQRRIEINRFGRRLHGEDYKSKYGFVCKRDGPPQESDFLDTASALGLRNDNDEAETKTRAADVRQR